MRVSAFILHASRPVFPAPTKATRRRCVSALAILGIIMLSGCATGPPSPLPDAAMAKDFDTVRHLIKMGTDVDQPNSVGTTALCWACINQDFRTEVFLLQHGADPNKKSSYGCLPLSYAILPMDGSIAPSPNQITMVKLLLAAGAALNEPASGLEGGKSYIDRAVIAVASRRSGLDLLDLLIDAGEKPSAAARPSSAAWKHVAERAKNPPTQEQIDAFREGLRQEMAKYLRPVPPAGSLGVREAQRMPDLTFEVPE